MNFIEALKTLGIEDYSERIFSSNSHGELFHIQMYFEMAKLFIGNKKEFKEWFDAEVKLAEETWKRPESIFQHINKRIDNKTFDKFFTKPSEKETVPSKPV